MTHNKPMKTNEPSLEEMLDNILSRHVMTPLTTWGKLAEALTELITSEQKAAYQQGYDDRTLEADHELEDAQKALIDKIEGSLPNRKTDISGYHEDFTGEQLTRITAENRAHNKLLSEVTTILKQAKEEL